MCVPHLSIYHTFTDGAYTSVSAGTAFVAFDPRGQNCAVHKFKVINASGAYSAEVVTFTETIHYLTMLQTSARVRIYTDCLSLLPCPLQHT